MNRTWRWTPTVLMVGVLIGAGVFGPSVARRIAYAMAEGEARARREHLAEMSKQDTLSPLFRAVAEVVRPAVVEIRVTKRFQTSSDVREMEEFMRRFFGNSRPAPMPPRGRRPVPREYFSRGIGSGVIVDAKNGYVITNAHVVAGADEVEIILDDKRVLMAEWVRSDTPTDLAVVKVKASGLIDAPLGDSDKLQVGDWVLAFGSPRGLDHTVTAGIVSAKGRQFGGLGAYQNSIQTDAAINRGNSGGPLVNTRGEIVGINNTIASSSGGNEGIGFAIPANMVRRVMAQLIEQGKVTRGYLGVMIQDVSPRLAKSLELPSANGALITHIQAGTPAEQAGLEVEDFIISVADKTIRDVRELRHMVADVAPGVMVPVVVIRKGKTVTVEVTLAAKPEQIASATTQPGPTEVPAVDYGLRVHTLAPELARRLGYDDALEGVVIVAVNPISEAAEQGVRPGMVVTHVQGERVTTPEAFTKALAAAEATEGVRLRVRTRQGQRFVMIDPIPPPGGRP
ncbi:hypothetical protein LCGC14_0315610 [marine sediment metagenome]|uniref:Probable periplasmic serine endoprotease DegP-like n=1 Tax=marine sediment metagenome TaxID=412755 RepID=A0A0F9W826_9ZZZZ